MVTAGLGRNEHENPPGIETMITKDPSMRATGRRNEHENPPGIETR